MAKDHGPSIKSDKRYEGLRAKGMSKERAAKIANSPGSSKRGGKSSGSGTKRKATSQGGTKAQKAAAGRKGAKRAMASCRRSPSCGRLQLSQMLPADRPVHHRSWCPRIDGHRQASRKKHLAARWSRRRAALPLTAASVRTGVRLLDGAAGRQEERAGLSSR
jgi:hypothetical protein